MKPMPMRQLFTTLAYRWENGYHFIANNDPSIDISSLAAAGLVYFDRMIEQNISCKYCRAHGEIYWNDYGMGLVCMFGCGESDCRATYIIDRETLKGWKVNDTVILQSLVESLGMKEKITEMVADQIWKLGRRQRREYFFIRSVNNDNISQHMAMFGNQLNTVLITTRDTDTIRRFMPNITCFSLYDVGTLDKNYRIVFDLEMIESIVGSSSVEEESAVPDYQFSRSEGWEFYFAGRKMIPNDNLLGFYSIQHLLKYPHEIIYAGELEKITSEHGPSRSVTTNTNEADDDGEVVSCEAINHDDVLDREAREQYRQRLIDLAAQRRWARDNDPIREKEIDDEYQIIENELSNAKTIHGKTQNIDSSSRNLAKRVTKNINTAIEKIEAGLPDFAAYLRNTIYFGLYLFYSPHEKIDWHF